jgi:hypothetical protein
MPLPSPLRATCSAHLSRLCLWIFRNKDTFSRWGVVSPSPNPQAGGPPLVGCPRMLIQYICGYPPHGSVKDYKMHLGIEIVMLRLRN